MIRIKCGCKRVKRLDDLSYLNPIFTEVYEKALKEDSTISPKVRFFLSDDDCPNALATGRKTVCITRGMLNEKPIVMKAVLRLVLISLPRLWREAVLYISVCGIRNGINHLTEKAPLFLKKW